MKRILFLSFLCVVSFKLYAQPDACTTPSNLTPQTTCGATTGQSLQNSTATGSPTNAAGPTKDVWYTFTTPIGITSVTITLSAPGNNIDNNSYIEAFSNGSCGSGTFTGTSLGTSAITTAAGTSLTLNSLSPSTLYHFRVFTTAANTSTGGAGNWQYSICVSYEPPLANNLCSAATDVTPVTNCGTGALANQTLLSSTATGSPTNAAGTTNDVWYTFTTPANIRNVQISASNLGANLTVNNTYIEAFTASSCAAGVFSGTSIGTSVSGTPTLSLTNLTPSTQYYFRVFTTGTATGGTNSNWGFSICVSYNAVPSNDNCSGSTALTIGTTNSTGNLLNATASGTTVGCATGTPDDDVWFSFTPTQVNATIALSSVGADLNSSGAMLQLYEGSCGLLNSVACGQNSINASGLQTGSLYYVRVYSSGSYTTTPATGSPANTFSITVTQSGGTNVLGSNMVEVFKQTTLVPAATQLNDPWEITYGSDGYLWITEAKGYNVVRMDPVTGTRSTVLSLAPGASGYLTSIEHTNYNRENWTNSGSVPWPQGGMMGLALHPDFNTDPLKRFVYIGYVADQGLVPTDGSGQKYTNFLVRFTYNTSTEKLENPVTLCDTLPGSSDHNSGRIMIAPINGVNYLFYSSGDMGSGQYTNVSRPIKAQLPESYEGKILRFNLEPDGDAAQNIGVRSVNYNQWIPSGSGSAGNPFNSYLSTQSAVWNTGHRNVQGFAIANLGGTNYLYGSSHGPFSDDEINILEAGKNYGHPLVIGYSADGNYNGAKAGPATGSLPFIALSNGEQNNVTSINGLAWGTGYKDPVFTFYPVAQGSTTTCSGPNQYLIQDIYRNCAGTGSNNFWKSEAPSGMDIYTNTVIPGWKNSLVLASLKWGRMVRVKLNSTYDGVAKVDGVVDTMGYFKSQNRYRDLAISPDGKDIFIITDKSTSTSGPSTANPSTLNCGGCVVKYTFLGYNSSAGTSTIPTSIPIDAGNLNNCATGTAVTINSANNNTNLWVPLTGPDGNIVAEINANGNNLGNVTSSFYTKAGAARQTAGGVKYMNRNITINVQNQPSTNVSVRLYITADELQDMITSTGGTVTGINDIGIFKNNDGCSNSVSATPTSQTITGRYTHGTYGYAIQSDISSFSTFYFMSTTATLPANVITFKATAAGDAAKLQWTVEDQTNVERYIVERSSNNINFTAIGSVDARGNANERIDYQFTDINAASFASTVYYRIKIADKDGNAKYTNVVPVSFENYTRAFVTVQPNPVVNNATVLVTSTTEETAQLRITDNTGRVVMSKNIRLAKGRNTLELNVSNLTSGLYYLDITGKNINEKTKLVKQ